MGVSDHSITRIGKQEQTKGDLSAASLEIYQPREQASKNIETSQPREQAPKSNQTSEVREQADKSKSFLPTLTLHDGADRHAVVIHGKEGRSDTVTGTTAQAGESLKDLIHRFHPALTETELGHELARMLKYNKAYGNDLGDGSHFDGGKQVFLTSVKTTDSQGRVTRIESPTGRLTEITYDGNGCSGYKIVEADGRVTEEVQRAADGKRTRNSNGLSQEVQSVSIDKSGNITVTDSTGNKVAHLTRGDDVTTRYANGRPVESITTREGEETTRYAYEYEGNTLKVFATYASNPGARVLLSENNASDALERVRRGLGMQENSDAKYAGDIPSDEYVTSQIVRTAFDNLGKASYDFQPGVPTNLGCATFVSHTLKGAGFDRGVIDIGCSGLEHKLQSRHFERISEDHLQAGDIVFGQTPGKHSHTGIYIGNGKIIANSSRAGYAKVASYEGVFGGFARRFGYRYVGDA